jgi:acetylornithine deacetylase
MRGQCVTTVNADIEDAVLRVLDPEKISTDLSHLVQVPSITGAERNVIERFGEIAESCGLTSTVFEHDLKVLRGHPDYPGDEASREELLGLTSVIKGGSPDAPRICLNGHLDVVAPGTITWEHDPWSGVVHNGFLYGRGSADMKGGVIAALHAIAAIKLAIGEVPGDIVLQAVASEEDGGAGTFAALERDSAFAACIIPEPSGFKLCCAHAGALTFVGTVPGVSAHAAMRLEGISAIDRYIPIHQALWEYERHINSDVRNPLMAALDLPYPIAVGRIEAGTWSSQVPDRLRFEGRLGVRVGERIPEAIAAFEAVVRRACPEVELSWSGGKFAPAETPVDHPLVGVARTALADELGHPAELVGFPAGADMRLFTARGIPCVMVGTNGLELAHAVNERVSVEDVYKLARVLARCVVRLQFGDGLRGTARPSQQR